MPERNSATSAATHGDTGPQELLADRAPMNTQLGTDLAQRPPLGVQVGRTLNVHRATVAAHAKGGSPLDRGVYVNVSD